MTYKDDARSSRSGKASRLIGSETDAAPRIAAAESSKAGISDSVKKLARACGGAVAGGPSARRLDKPARARGGSVKGKGKTTVNVIVSPQGGQGAGASPGMALPPAPSPIAPPMPPGGGAPLPLPPGGAGMPPKPMGAGSPVPPVPMRKRGGRVKDGGAGSGIGRLEKAGLA